MVTYAVKDGQENVEITNVEYEMTGAGIPGRPNNERLLLRKTTKTKQVVDEIGMEASTTVEAWPLGVDPKQKPLYSFKVEGLDCRNINNEILLVSRGLEETDWWSVYKLGNGAHLMDTYVPLVQFSISRETLTTRYVGLEVPEDNAADVRLRKPTIVAVLTYASPERVIREVLITADAANQAVQLRSFADATRTVSYVESGSSRTLKFSVSQNYPSRPDTISMSIPIVKDDLDTAHAVAPAGLHVTPWKR
ncbi:MAG TPA: hypothetical protein VKU01_02910 [Bryobacteraceae bacterium]|nr:hypothetical protein [Bryobacteraceae bacterium]